MEERGARRGWMRGVSIRWVAFSSLGYPSSLPSHPPHLCKTVMTVSGNCQLRDSIWTDNEGGVGRQSVMSLQSASRQIVGHVPLNYTCWRHSAAPNSPLSVPWSWSECWGVKLQRLTLDLSLVLLLTQVQQHCRLQWQQTHSTRCLYNVALPTGTMIGCNTKVCLNVERVTRQMATLRWSCI